MLTISICCGQMRVHIFTRVDSMFTDRVRFLLGAIKNHKAERGNLAPTPELNGLFAELRALAQQSQGQDEIQQTTYALRDVMDDLYQLNAEAGFALEQHWGVRIQQASDPMAELQQFPLWDNYVRLTGLDVAAMRHEKPDMKSVLFVGAGPLPLTAFIMATQYQLDVTNLDIDSDATCCATAWMERVLGVASLPCVHMDVMDFTDFGKYDAVVMAAMVGLDVGTKQRVLAHLHANLRPDQLLLVRCGSLLYPQLTAEQMTGFNVTDYVQPRDGVVVNKAILARKAA